MLVGEKEAAYWSVVSSIVSSYLVASPCKARDYRGLRKRYIYSFETNFETNETDIHVIM
jgi:hypothetical protein